MTRFRMVEGRQSFQYNHFLEYKVESCIATNTRLMGVVALKITWRSRDSREHLYQLFHLDYSEYGIDEYLEYFTDPDMQDLSMIQSRAEYRSEWTRISGSLGGTEVRIPLGSALRLIRMSLDINEHHFHKHEPSIQDFRKKTIARIELMKEAIEQDMPRDIDLSEKLAMSSVCLKERSIFETINYFLMRLSDLDYKAASYLSTMSEEELRAIPVWEHRMMTLMRNRIRRVDRTNRYYCTILTEGDIDYHYMRATITLDTTPGKKQSLVSDFTCDYCAIATEYEAALQLRYPEYITVYNIQTDLNDFDLDHSHMAANALMSSVPNGILYVLYNSDNSHVDTDNYYMNHDLYGGYLVTSSKELVVMSSELMKISMLEMDIANSFFNGELELGGRYKFVSQIFQTFCEMSGAKFTDILK